MRAREGAHPAHQRAATTTSRSAPAWARRRRCNIVVLPVLFEGEVKAVIELASFEQFSDIHLAFLDQLTESIGIVLNTIAANMRTEELLKQSQALTEELQSQQHELTRRTSAWSSRRRRCSSPRSCSRSSKRSCSRPTKSSKKRRSCSPSRRPRSSARTTRSSSPRRARGEGRAARAHLEVQVRVPREHVARAAHAAQQPARSCPRCSPTTTTAT